MEFKRSEELDLIIQDILLNAFRLSPSEDSIEVEHINPRAVGMIVNLTEKPPQEAIMILHSLHSKYPACPEALVPEIDALIESARLRAENAYKNRGNE